MITPSGTAPRMGIRKPPTMPGPYRLHKDQMRQNMLRRNQGKTTKSEMKVGQSTLMINRRVRHTLGESQNRSRGFCWRRTKCSRRRKSGRVGVPSPAPPAGGKCQSSPHPLADTKEAHEFTRLSKRPSNENATAEPETSAKLNLCLCAKTESNKEGNGHGIGTCQLMAILCKLASECHDLFHRTYAALLRSAPLRFENGYDV